MSDAVAGAEVVVKGAKIPKEDIVSVLVDMDIDQSDMAVITLRNSYGYGTKFAHGDALEVKTGSGKDAIFKGEIVGLEPLYTSGGASRVLLRAMTRLHRLMRGRRPSALNIGRIVSKGAALQYYENLIRALQSPSYPNIRGAVQDIVSPVRKELGERSGQPAFLAMLEDQVLILLEELRDQRMKVMWEVKTRVAMLRSQ